MLDKTSEMMFPIAVVGEIDGTALDGVVSKDESGDFWFKSDSRWSGGTQCASRAAKRKVFRGHFGSIPVYLSGDDFHKDGSPCVRVSDLRVGFDAPDDLYLRARSRYQYGALISSYYARDGVQRPPKKPLILPALEGAPAMKLTYAGDLIELEANTPTKLEHFEAQLEALRRLLTFAVQRPLAQVSMCVYAEEGSETKIFARQLVKSGPIVKLDHRDFPIRLGNENTQNAIHKWWDMSINLRPLPQIVAGIIAKPGYSEADFLFVATVLDRLGEEWVNVPKILTKEKFLEVRRAIAAVDVPDDFQITNVSTFAARTEAIADLLPAKVWDKLGLDKASWTTSLKRYRNLVAHSDAQKAAHREFMTGNGLPALRDATIVVVTLLMAQHMGVTDDALVFAAERQRYSWIQKYTNGTLTFTTKGLGAES